MKISLGTLSLLTGLLVAGNSLAATTSLYTYNYTGAATTEQSYNDGILPDSTSDTSLDFGAFDPGAQLEISFTLGEALPLSDTFGFDIYGSTSENAAIFQNGIDSPVSLSGLSISTGHIDHLNFPNSEGLLLFGNITTDANGDIVAWDIETTVLNFDRSFTNTSSTSGDTFGYQYEFGGAQDTGLGFDLFYFSTESASAATTQIGNWSSNVEIIPNPLPPGMALSVGGLGMLLGVRRIQKRRRSNT